VHRALGNLLSFDAYGDISALQGIYAPVAQVYGMPQLTSLERLNTRETMDAKMEAVQAAKVTPEIQEILEKRTRLDSIVYNLALDHLRSISRRPNS
jgi:hypothetical protein